MTKGKLGILGGMGPEATLEFYRRVISFTAAERDQDHIETLILSDTGMPDRTAAILSGETQPVVDRLLADARLLEAWGAACIAIPCNTSHTFFPQLQAGLGIPIVNMVVSAAAELEARGVARAGILATDGTVRMGLYRIACQARGIEAVSPPPELQRRVMAIIYDQVKAGRPASREDQQAVDSWLVQAGCGCGLLACTELSVCSWEGLSGRYLDAMDALARRCVELCGCPLKNT